MAGREVREYTNLTDPKGKFIFLPNSLIFFFLWHVGIERLMDADKKFGKGKDRIDDEEITFQRMVAKVRDPASPLFFC